MSEYHIDMHSRPRSLGLTGDSLFLAFTSLGISYLTIHVIVVTDKNIDVRDIESGGVFLIWVDLVRD